MILDERGNKMSKSEGNVIDPINQIGKFGIGAFRYYLLSGINTFQNSSYSEEELINKYNNDLSNNLGNLISRVTSIIEKEPEFFHSEIEGHDFLKKPKNKMFELIKGIKNKNSSFISYSSAEIKKAHEEIQVNLNVKNAFTILNNLVTQTNKYFTIKKPYDKLLPFEERRNCIVEMLYIIKELYYFYAAATPNIQNQYLSIFRSEKISKTKIDKRSENGNFRSGSKKSIC
jgi:methionyl-tRNA synthetase